MRKKPMLINKLLGRQSHREIIGLMGAHPGAGVTFTGLMLAFYLGEAMGIRTAFLECNSHHDFSLLQSAYEWSREEPGSFTFGNVTCYKEVTSERVAGILGDNYGCFILDFGTDVMTNKEEFLRCDRKLVLGGWAEWNYQKLCRFIRSSDSLRGNETWKYLVPYAGQKLIRDLHQQFKRKFYMVPLEVDPTRPSKETKRLFQMLLG